MGEHTVNALLNASIYTAAKVFTIDYFTVTFIPAYNKANIQFLMFALKIFQATSKH